MALSCIILNYNDSENTINLLKNIKDFNSIDNIIIVDNCSTDDSYAELIKYKSEKVQIILSEKNGGYGYGNNIGIKYANDVLKSDFVLISNPDVCFDKSCVDSMLHEFSINKEMTVLAPVPYTILNKPQYVYAWRIPSKFYLVISASGIAGRLLLKRQRYKDINIELKAFKVECVAGSLLMVRTNEMIEHGMYDENLFLYGEETVLGLKLKKANLKTFVMTDLKYIHKHSESIDKTYSTAIRKQKILLKSKEYILKNYYSVNGIQLVVARLFFKYSIIETYITQNIRKIQKMIKDKSSANRRR
ncbi:MULTISPECIES: glycosyltransferase family 2 protein [unclassified Fusibacter]|uniref:glycosyltransferase family 2 protein n=1 Tax=unclassified Fusibacter TaxID=2624464 RepID=UPI001011FC8C|nr:MULTISPECIES: glycosyltransferase [unclassified Fusibacter]MCK8061253.1 glycosyltransferase [Fusibacter sp. A2]NPE23403.1 glycosyltransferase family 2 protein [Fusibacter sp. A1]RXV59183.1 glycosyltransferase family 2 protein [Fusibacter sp. A1]